MNAKLESENGVPNRVIYLVANEVAERFSFYGMTAILPTFLRDQFFGGVETDANAVLHLFRSGVYLFPLIGAIIADGLIGRYKTIRNLSVLYVIGHLLLAVFAHSFIGFSIGLFVIAFASGGVKPNVSAFIGGQVEEASEKTRQKAFNLLYFCINLGGAISQILVPLLRSKFGIEVAFLVPGAAMLLALVVFVVPNKSYVKHVPASPKQFLELFSTSNLKAVIKASRVFVFVIIFMALYEENAGAWVFQAQHLDLTILGLKFAPEQVQSCNGIFVLALVPLFAFVIYPWLGKRGLLTNPLQRVGLGFLMMLMAYSLVTGLQFAIEKQAHPNVGWQIGAYFLLTVAEVLVVVNCLQLAFERANKDTKSIVTAMFLLSVSIGNLVGTFLSSALGGTKIGAAYYVILCCLMVVNCAGFYLYYRREARKISSIHSKVE